MVLYDYRLLLDCNAENQKPYVTSSDSLSKLLDKETKTREDYAYSQSCIINEWQTQA